MIIAQKHCQIVGHIQVQAEFTISKSRQVVPLRALYVDRYLVMTTSIIFKTLSV